MASANLELVRSIYAGHERGDFSSTQWAHPQIELVIADGPSPGRWSGLAEMADAWGDFLGAWEGYRVDVEEYRELDGERVLVLTERSGRGKTSGLELKSIGPKGANLFEIRDGKVLRVAFYWDRERAFADLGFPPATARRSLRR